MSVNEPVRLPDDTDDAHFRFRFFMVSGSIRQALKLAADCLQTAIEGVLPDNAMQGVEPDLYKNSLRYPDDFPVGYRYLHLDTGSCLYTLGLVQIFPPGKLPFRPKKVHVRLAHVWGTTVEFRFSEMDSLCNWTPRGRHARYRQCVRKLMADIGSRYGIVLPVPPEGTSRVLVRLDPNFAMVGYGNDGPYKVGPDWMGLKQIGVFPACHPGQGKEETPFLSSPQDCFKLFELPVPQKLAEYPNKPWTNSGVQAVALSLLSEGRTTEQGLER